ncbi:uncharacterized protein LOC116296682 [Actinia tenebrosa]|uniref:Uncharacterized protein LOC116296682 n=1 Tax=Actinia tenebrosa TaxID=6105 RepID=A0A6P8I6E8_ACTTE|nr:uncharacterized protein LOC116296682 [Actinia tenebrosa]XP_031560598.1 uncharacterized protein LOC116296682 [Actinia tenebrosa]XP_031560599.1 uncharacterized protein LOC116296682 [Actinia tenebrosa]
MVLQHAVSFTMVVSIFLSISKMADTGPTMTCPERYTRKGCYKDSVAARALPDLLISGRVEIEESWGNWDMFIQSFICRCAIESRKRGYKYFGIQFYGECWSGNVTSAAEYAVHGPSDECVGRDQGICKKDTSLCVGKSFANFVYEIPLAPTTKPPASDCKDVLDKCPLYADQGLCIDRYPDVLSYCPFSCGKCTV